MSSPGERYMERVYCGEDLVIEQVVTTTYKLICPIHGEYSKGLSLQEAKEHTRCVMPKEKDETQTNT